MLRRKWQIKKTFIKMESNDKLKEIDIKNRTSCYFNEKINIEDFYLDKILIDWKLYENILVYNISYKSLIDSKPFLIRFGKQMDLLEFMIELDI